MQTILQSLSLNHYSGLGHFMVLPPCYPGPTEVCQPNSPKNNLTSTQTIGFRPCIIAEIGQQAMDLDASSDSISDQDIDNFSGQEVKLELRRGSGFRRARKGSYKKYTPQQKKNALQQIRGGRELNVVITELQIPRRSLLRWRKHGCQRKEGGGRPSDFLMESELFRMIMSSEISGESEIRQQALKFSSFKKFKASKGWYVKFCRRFNEFKRRVNSAHSPQPQTGSTLQQ